MPGKPHDDMLIHATVVGGVLMAVSMAVTW